MPIPIHRFALIRLCTGVKFLRAASVQLRDGVRVGRGAVVDARAAMVTVELGAWLGRAVTLFTGEACDGAATGGARSGAVWIGPGATVGARAIVLPNTRIGARAIVGAGSLVADDVAEGAIVSGVPARRIGRHAADGSLEFIPPLSHQPRESSPFAAP